MANNAVGSPARSRVGIALALTTLGVLVLELALTRLFSVVLFYHYAFLVISIALLGLAVGGIVARLGSSWSSTRDYDVLMGRTCLIGAIVLVPVLSLILGTNLWLVTAWVSLERLIWLFLACAVPFALAGFVVSTAIARAGDNVASVYSYDLAGASAGCLLFVPLVSKVGGPAAILTVGVIWCIATLVWVWGSKVTVLRSITLVAAAGLSGLVVAAATGGAFDIRFLHGAPAKPEVFQKWNSFSRVSVFTPDSGVSNWIEIDGGAGSWISAIDPNGATGDALRPVVGNTGPGVAYSLIPKPNVLVIGPGGGVDVARALVVGSPLVTAVEINPIIARDIMLDAFRKESHGLYARPDVRLIIKDGRTFIEQTTDRFDVILLSQVDTWASSAAGSYALTENYLYTVEAIQRYYEHLTDRGIVSIGRWEFKRPRETLRLMAVVLEALRKSGVAEPSAHVVVLMEAMGPETPLRLGTVLVSRAPWDKQRLAAIDARVAESPMEYAWAPHTTRGEGPFRALALAQDKESFFDTYPFDVTPVTDDRPFFFFNGRWSNALANLFVVDADGDALNTNAQFLLAGLLLTAAVAVLAFLFLPMLLFSRSFPRVQTVWPFLVFGVALGLGYIVLEIALIQRLVILLGQPVYALTVVIFVVLLSSALGSRFSGSFSPETLPARIRFAALAVAALALLWIWPLPLAARTVIALPQIGKLAVIAIAIFPLGFLMGIPFPSGLRIAAGPAQVVEWTWTMNAAASVLGTVLAIFAAVTLGISASFGFAALAYLTAAAVSHRMAAAPGGS